MQRLSFLIISIIILTACRSSVSLETTDDMLPSNIESDFTLNDRTSDQKLNENNDFKLDQSDMLIPTETKFDMQMNLTDMRIHTMDRDASLNDMTMNEVSDMDLDMNTDESEDMTDFVVSFNSAHREYIFKPLRK